MKKTKLAAFLVVALTLLLCGCQQILGESSTIRVSFAAPFSNEDVNVIEARLRDASDAVAPRFDFRRDGNTLEIDARGAPPESLVKSLLSRRGMLEARGTDGLVWFSGREVVDCAAGFDADGSSPVLHVTLNQTAKARVAMLSTSRTGAKLDLMLDGQVLSSPIVREKIANGFVQIAVPDGTTAQQVLAIAGLVKTGMLSSAPVSVEVGSK